MDFEEIYHKYEKLVWYFLKNIRCKEDAEDISQEVWLTLWQKRDKVEEGRWPSFIYSVCRNKIGNLIHFSKRDLEWLPIEDGALEVPFIENYSEVELLDEIERILDKDEYELFILYYLYGNTQTDISKRYGYSQAAISRKVNNIKDKLSCIIKNQDL